MSRFHGDKDLWLAAMRVDGPRCGRCGRARPGSRRPRRARSGP